MEDWLYKVSDRVFPVIIDSSDETLSIDDRRPDRMLLYTVVIIPFFILGFGIIQILFRGFGRFSVLLLFPLGLSWSAAFLLSFFSTYRERYVFNKPNDTYYLTRYRIWKKDVLKGRISELVSVRLYTSTTDMRTFGISYAQKDKYKVILVKQGSGKPDTDTLRTLRPIVNRFDVEGRIQGAIASFLHIREE